MILLEWMWGTKLKKATITSPIHLQVLSRLRGSDPMHAFLGNQVMTLILHLACLIYFKFLLILSCISNIFQNGVKNLMIVQSTLSESKIYLCNRHLPAHLKPSASLLIAEAWCIELIIYLISESGILEGGRTYMIGSEICTLCALWLIMQSQNVLF